MANFFIRRPIFAWVLAIILMMAVQWLDTERRVIVGSPVRPP
ncbi:hypothetical protein ACUOFC_61890, partial [Escherichia sp. TWPC-MK]